MSRMTSRERILKHCEVQNRNRRGDNIIYGEHEFRMNRLFINTPDSDLDRILTDKDLTIGAYIAQKESDGKQAGKQGKHTTTVNLNPKPCECGCGGTTRRGSRFLMGHDMKLKSRLRKAATDGDSKARNELSSRGWA